MTEDERKREQEEEYLNPDFVFNRIVKAGKRTYFFDVKQSRRNDNYLIITESKKSFDRMGRQVFEKHKLFLYKEDVDKFNDALKEAIQFVKNNNNSAHELYPNNSNEDNNKADKQDF